MNGERVDASLVTVKLDLRRYRGGNPVMVLRIFP